MDPVIFLVDMNSYFASVEQLANPQLKGRPIAVCGSGRTVVTTASYEARAFGVKTGMSVPEARRQCPQLITVCGNLDKYVDTSRRIHRVMLEFTDQVEPFSIDECFMDVSHRCARGAMPRDIGRQLKARIRQELGLVCSVGIGPNKLVAKLASKMQKPDGLVEIRREDITGLFETLEIDRMQGVGIGRRTAEHLQRIGITTAGQLGRASQDFLMAHFGISGYHLGRMGRGEDTATIKRYGADEQPKSVGNSHTLPRDTRDLSVIRGYILMLSEQVGTRMRREGLTGATVSVAVRYADFTTFSRQRRLGRHIRDTGDVFAEAWKVFNQVLPLVQPVRLLGVCMSDVLADDGQQFLLEEMARKRLLSDTVDAINRKYGDRTLKPAGLLVAERFGVQERCGVLGTSFLRSNKLDSNR